MPQPITISPVADSSIDLRRRVRYSIALKLAALLLAVALVPLGIASFVNVKRGLMAVEQTALQNLQLLATVTATQIDQLIVDIARTQQIIGADERVEQFCQASPADRARLLPSIQRKLDQIVKANPDITSVFITDDAAIGLAGTNERNVGMDFNFREYVRKALAGEQHISEILVGKTTARPGVYFSGPVRDADGKVIGATVLKLEGERLHAICDAVKVPGGRGMAAITDKYGIILAHPNKELLYKSIRRLESDQIALINPMLRYEEETIESLNIDELTPLIGADTPGSSRYIARATGETMILGYAPMTQREWIVSISQPRADFERPITRLKMEQTIIAVAVGLVSTMLGLWAARSLVRPLKKLTQATERLAEGDMTARADVNTRDEIGELAYIFNGMVPKLEEHSKMQDALRLAMEIQRNLLPQAPPKINGLDIAGLNVPADETGGDYYDFLDLSTWHGGTLAIAVGDVTGHGISAALLMATARAMLRSRATPPGELVDLISDVNERLYDDTPDERFMTLMYMLVNRDLSYLRLVSAGHDPVIMYDPARGNFSEIEGDDIPLAVDRTWKFTEKRYDLIPLGAILLIGTDGIWEARNSSGEMFGKDRLNELLRKHHHEPAAAIVRAVADALVAFNGQTRQKDDVTIVVIKFVEKT